jgi:hypothetical protein
VKARVGGEDASSNTLGATGGEDEYVHNLAIFSSGAAPAGRAERWSRELSPSTAGSTSYWDTRWRNLGFHKDKDWDSVASVVVTDVQFAKMSADWRAYTSLDLAVVDLDSGTPPKSELAALVAWVRTGGEVALVGQDINAKLARLDVLAPWLEDRFLLASTPGAPRVRRYQCGFGRILVAEASALFDDRGLVASVMAEARERIRTGWTPSPRASRGRGLGLDPAIPGMGSLPYRAFIVLMILFGVLVWPVNFYFVKRSGKPVRLLFTIPAIAFGASLLVLIYGFFWQGLDIKTQSVTQAVLDQRTGIVDHAEARALYAGLAPGRGLVPGAGTAVFPWTEHGDWTDNTVFRIDYRAGEQRYGAGFLPSRTQIRQLLLSDRATRLRLEFHPDGSLTNGLGVDLVDLIVHAPDGGWWRLDGKVPAGDSGRLVETGEPKHDAGNLPAFEAGRIESLPRATYSARTSTAALRDTAGLELIEVEGEHTLLGVFPLDTAFPGASQ